MRIGIDIDDTITKSWEFLIPYFSELYNIPQEQLKKSLPYYRSVENIVSKEEYFQNIRELSNKLMMNCKNISNLFFVFLLSTFSTNDGFITTNLLTTTPLYLTLFLGLNENPAILL